MASDPMTAPGRHVGYRATSSCCTCSRCDLPPGDSQPRAENRTTVRSFCGDLAELLRAVGFCIIGRKKLSDIELDDTIKPTSAHNALATIVEDGKEIKILRDNMPFGRPRRVNLALSLIGYSRSPSTIEQVLENMSIDRPRGNYDRRSISVALSLETYFSGASTNISRKHSWRLTGFLMLRAEAAIALAPPVKSQKS